MKKFLKKNRKVLSVCNDTHSIPGRPVGRQGLTFIEMLMAVAIMSILILAIVSVSIMYLNSRVAVKKYQANNEELSLALNTLAKDIRMSDFNGVPPAPMPSGLQSSISLKNNATTNIVVYRFDGPNKNLLRSDDGGPEIVVASNVTGNFFVRGTKIGRITIMLNKAGPPGMSVQTTVSMRAKYKDENP
jgi:prepilin-type N-terminal cleavage/methylation domain-containing protein